jgi:hypothetical protein
MIRINDIAFDDYKVDSVELELDTCILTMRVIFSKDDGRVKQKKLYTFNTDCDVDINELIKQLKDII